MSKSKIFLFLQFTLFFSLPVLAQVETAWVRRYNAGNSQGGANALAVDDSGNVYVAGIGYDSVTKFDYITIKYTPNGDTVWVRSYNGPGNGYDEAEALAIDNSGNVYITGHSIGDIYPDYTTIKYGPNGDTIWVRRYNNGPGNASDVAKALVLDNAGNVYVTGWSSGSGNYYDYATIKYAPNGDTLWIRRYNGPGNYVDHSNALAIDDSGNVYVTGGSTGTIYPDFDYATIKYTPNGETVWVRRYDGPENYYDYAHALAVDDSGNVYVTGISYDSVTNFDYATIKYAPNGDTLWVRRYNGPGNLDDHAQALAVDGSGNVYVTGYSWSGPSPDYVTIKYASNGDTVWVRRYNGPGNSYDQAYALAVDDSGNVYVTGYSEGIGTSYDYATIKYAPDGDSVWVRRYNGLGNSNDLAKALAIDNSGNIYVTGSSIGSYPNYDYATVKYVQFACVAKPGDATGDGKILLTDVVTIINFLFRGAPAPVPFCREDANANGEIKLSDIVYLINFLFKSGPAPLKSGVCCL